MLVASSLFEWKGNLSVEPRQWENCTAYEICFGRFLKFDDNYNIWILKIQAPCMGFSQWTAQHKIIVSLYSDRKVLYG